ncbi:hypothetical protein scyTo_0009833 [Scyliorhinus torazame]|uniref:Uncharacterized protein n=1 Tax=Scyliorhinus torazame TaxID=75743 RepID=A0A401NUN4_SCYTO|nr:hypothetical protein [Scyliorhinus torazame]
MAATINNASLTLAPDAAVLRRLVGSAKQLESSHNTIKGKRPRSNATNTFSAEEFEETGPCSVTCGIGAREILLIKGCPGEERKCVIRVEECRGPVRCGCEYFLL